MSAQDSAYEVAPELLPPPHVDSGKDGVRRRPPKVSRTLLSRPGGAHRVSISGELSDPLGPGGERLLRLHVDARGDRKDTRAFVAILFDVSSDLDEAQAQVMRDTANELIARLGKAAVSLHPLSTGGRAYGQTWMSNDARKNMRRYLKGQTGLGPATLEPAVRWALGRSGAEDVVVLAASSQWVDEDATLERLEEKEAQDSRRVHVIAVGPDVDTAPLEAVFGAEVERAKGAGQAKAAVRTLERALPRTYFRGARLTVDVDDELRILGGGGVSTRPNNRNAVVPLGGLWTGHRNTVELLVIDSGPPGKRHIGDVALRYHHRNPEPGPTLVYVDMAAEITSMVR